MSFKLSLLVLGLAMVGCANTPSSESTGAPWAGREKADDAEHFVLFAAGYSSNLDRIQVRLYELLKEASNDPSMGVELETAGRNSTYWIEDDSAWVACQETETVENTAYGPLPFVRRACASSTLDTGWSTDANSVQARLANLLAAQEEGTYFMVRHAAWGSYLEDETRDETARFACEIDDTNGYRCEYTG